MSDTEGQYKSIYAYFEDEAAKLIPIELNKKWGFINEVGEIIVHPIFDEAFEFTNNLAAAKIKGKWGYIDNTGHFVIEPVFDRVNQFSSTLAWVTLDNKSILLNNKGITIAEISGDYQINEIYIEGMAIVQKEDKYGFVDLNGDLVIVPKYKSVSAFNSGLAIVTDDKDEIYYINKKGDKKSFVNISVASSFSEGLAYVRNKDTLKCGYINTNGELVIPYVFDNADFFSEGFASVSINGKKGYIDKTGSIVIEPQYDSAMPFINGVALASNEDQYLLVDKLGNAQSNLRKLDYVDIQSYLYHSDLFKVMSNRKFVLINRNNGDVVYKY